MAEAPTAGTAPYARSGAPHTVEEATVSDEYKARDGARARAEHQRDKAENLLRRARLSNDPEEAQRLRDQGERLKDQSEQALRQEPETERGDIREEYPR